MKLKKLILTTLVLTSSHLAFATDEDEAMNQVVEASAEAQAECSRPAPIWDHLNAADLYTLTRDKIRELDIASGNTLRTVILARDGKRNMDRERVLQSGPESIIDIAARATATAQCGAEPTQRGQALNTWRNCRSRAVAPLARSIRNQPATGEGMDMFHIAFALKTDQIGADGYNIWTVHHLLKPCDHGAPNWYTAGVAKFFLDDPRRFRASIMVPTPQVGARIRQVLLAERTRSTNKILASELLSDSYNAVATAYQEHQARKDQNSNQWVLEVIAAAQNPRGTIENRLQVQRFLRSRGYVPTLLQIRSLQYRVGKMFDPVIGSISITSQPFAMRHNLVELISVDSVEDYLVNQNIVQPINPSESGLARFRSVVEIEERYRWGERNFAREMRNRGGEAAVRVR